MGGNTWIRCPVCGHKLGRLITVKGITVIEVKCSSCKEVSTIKIENRPGQ